MKSAKWKRSAFLLYFDTNIEQIYWQKIESGCLRLTRGLVGLLTKKSFAKKFDKKKSILPKSFGQQVFCQKVFDKKEYFAKKKLIGVVALDSISTWLTSGIDHSFPDTTSKSAVIGSFQQHPDCFR